MNAPQTHLGFGASGAWGQKWFSKREAIRLIHQALDHGVRHFDSAGFYGSGEAETRLGEALRGRDDVFISVKGGTRNGHVGKKIKDFSNAALREDLHASLKRLKREHVETFYLHGPGFKEVYENEELMLELKQKGLINRAGVCGTGQNLDRSVDEDKTDAIMAIYNLFDQRHAEIFKKAREKNITVTAIAPLSQGFYRPGFLLPKTISDIWTITRFLARDIKRTRSLPKPVLESLGQFEGFSAAQMMLAFVMEQDFIDVAMTTSTKLANLDESLAIAHSLPPQEMRSELKEIADKYSQIRP